MNSNLPNDVLENTYGAPWNEQEYICKFKFSLSSKDNITLTSNTLITSFTLNGPCDYSEEELVETAIGVIKSEHSDFLWEYDCDIDIRIIYES